MDAHELALAVLNHGMPLGAMRYGLSPAAPHYVLIHCDMTYLEAAFWRLTLCGLVVLWVGAGSGVSVVLPQVWQASVMTASIRCSSRSTAYSVRPAHRPDGPDRTVGLGRAIWCYSTPTIRAGRLIYRDDVAVVDH